MYKINENAASLAKKQRLVYPGETGDLEVIEPKGSKNGNGDMGPRSEHNCRERWDKGRGKGVLTAALSRGSSAWVSIPASGPAVGGSSAVGSVSGAGSDSAFV